MKNSFHVRNGMSKNADRALAEISLNAQGLLTDAIRSDLKNLQGFSFHSHPDVEIPMRRLSLLSKIVNRQIDRILLE